MSQSGQRSSEGPVVVVGAGHGGANLVALLRQEGFSGEIVMFGDERHLPYHRPPLSKKFMDDDLLRQYLRPEAFYGENGIDLRLGAVVTTIDPQACTVTTADGEEVGYAYLVIATGSRPRQLSTPGMGSDGVLSLRTIDDAARLRTAIEHHGRLAIVGGGYIGLEVAAQARTHGVDVTVLEREKRVLARVASQEFSEFLTCHHRNQGTVIRTSVDVTEVVEKAGSVAAIDLADGERIECGSVLVGVGAIPNDEIAEGAGIACDGGILVDGNGSTGVPGVFAIGDVTRRPMGDGLMRFESIPSALEQAKRVAAIISGTRSPHPEVPWFWSDQFDLKLKIAGHVHLGHSSHVRHDVNGGKFGIFHLDETHRLVAVETVNASAYFMAGKKFIGGADVLDPDALADPECDLRACVVR
ncbi:NAD(P)/FAD-dependent oxidoreductase [Gordonia polyisoprenivorans]|uniref:NAD(P)/FAD-dependent oxidoreductase n=1 Tax=Gordonia polyisoprenivorans TaxID=84595 RepID=UPI000B99F363|nr:FAD-dependent oxidoreductase [Gordonia polyisoprenivorans]OZC29435.1 ferredoxin reductase [Gordonia polyisoprenivorans]